MLNMPADIRDQILGQKLKTGQDYGNIVLYFQLSTIVLFVQVFIYMGINLIQLHRHQKTLKDTYSYRERISLNWLLILVYFLIIHHLFELFVFVYPERLISESIYYVVKALIVLFIGIMGLRQREIYPKEKAVEEISILENANEGDHKRFHPISDELKTEAAQRITKLMEVDKLYLKPDFSLYDLSNRLEMHKNYVSYIINDVFKVNFFMFINNYRIEEAKKMLIDSRFNHLSIEGIAQNAGFKSRNVFYPVFKKLVGMTPLQYKMQKAE